ncbi:MAG: tRNA glutamyl-Q(34) synthetase GluQRS [Desulfovibrio sp.]|nr:tRNA glutamyl-Q(34) synthetase GluQRS [Desulfovibrio sp.]
MNLNVGSTPVGRLAPSPTGLLHLGNAWSFLLAWLSCRSQSGRLILRIEDIDPVRSRARFSQQIIDDLQWLGVDWDEGPDQEGKNGPYVQSARKTFYAEAISRLQSGGDVYPCFCTRKDLKGLASAPHNDDVGPVYPGTCRHLSETDRERRIAKGDRYSLRFRVQDAVFLFRDQIYGEQRLLPSDFGGDFALLRSDGVVSYQLAVAIDDSLMGVSEVVRGRDLLFSTPRQLLLLRALGMPEPSCFMHVPLLLDSSGERLAKRHSSLSLVSLRTSGIRADEVIGFLAFLAGCNPSCSPLFARDLLRRFSRDSLPRRDCRLCPQIWSRFFPSVPCP